MKIQLLHFLCAVNIVSTQLLKQYLMPIIALFMKSYLGKASPLAVSISLFESTDFGPNIASASVTPALSV
jgi:hypothetical protein